MMDTTSPMPSPAAAVLPGTRSREKASRGDLERLRLPGMVQFRDEGAGSFMLDWMRDQADLFMREGDPTLELPAFDFPKPHNRGTVQ